ncbi:hypothetical protein N781_00385 [Pontibacillus halophilus JSM 076056 = DSM 19796]|uniref:Uncharacterized protein n=1 Tax=Pontibacillus halophilus JSM 076056 = DSM 19796 TaxID=1385510 RepID=A0A0A5GSD8_9BACI|nr:hypothetical protein [Pontibacillus halophilus]KGX94045.1 hypothetical protein N781_00385 [Pontibacillus halophilus JSM 076056 = DSM 19796]
MFDTVKLGVPLALSIEEIQRIEWDRINTNYRTNNGSRTVFHVLHDASLRGAPFIRYTYKEDDPDRCWLKVEASIPNFLIGSNVYEINNNDIDNFFKVIRKYLSLQLKVSIGRIPTKEHFIIEKLHVCKNFQVGHHKTHYLQAVSSKVIAKFDRAFHFEKGSDRLETVEWKGAKKEEKIYDKEAEVRQQKNYDDKEKHLMDAKGLLRYEIELSDREIREVNPSRKAVDLLDMDFGKEVIQKGLDRNGLSAGVKYTSYQEVIDDINIQSSNTRSSTALIGFFTELFVNGEEMCKSKYSSSGYRKRRSKLLDVLGVDDLLISDAKLPPLLVVNDLLISDAKLPPLLVVNKKTASVLGEQ